MRPVLFIVVFFFGGMVYSQNLKQGAHFLKLAYLGEKITHPGLQLGYNYRISVSQNQKQAMDFGAIAGAYTHPKNHAALRIAPTIGYRYYLKNGWQLALTAECGYFQRIYNGTVYSVDGNGTVTEVSRVAKATWQLGSFVNIAKDFGKNETATWGMFCEIGMFREINNAVNPSISHPALLFGVSRRLNYAH